MRWVQLCGSLSLLWHCLSLGLEWKLTSSSPVVTAEFSKFPGMLSVELSKHHLLRFEIASTGIPSPPLALFVVMVPKAHLTSHSRISGSRWVITPSWLSGSWRSFLYSSSVYSCCLFLLSSAVGSGQTGNGKSERRHSRNQWTKMVWVGGMITKEHREILDFLKFVCYPDSDDGFMDMI